MPYFYVLRKIENHCMQKSIESRTLGASAALFCAEDSVVAAISRSAFASVILACCLFFSIAGNAQEDLFLVFGSVKLEDAISGSEASM